MYVCSEIIRLDLQRCLASVVIFWIKETGRYKESASICKLEMSGCSPSGSLINEFSGLQAQKHNAKSVIIEMVYIIDFIIDRLCLMRRIDNRNLMGIKIVISALLKRERRDSRCNTFSSIRNIHAYRCERC